MKWVDDSGTGRAEGSEGGPRRLGKYELVARLAEGGMAEVHLARLDGVMGFHKAVVVKVVHPHLAVQREFLQMLFDEARLSAAIKHPRVVDIYDLGREGSVYFMAMEYIAGQPLWGILRAGRAGDPLGPLGAARIVADAADGLHAAHELCGARGQNLGVVHRDISPGNIMVRYDGEVKIVDFGIAKARGRLTESGAFQFKGKTGYVAPEQMLRGHRVDRRSDIFGLGVVMWEALALKRLFPSPRSSGRLRGASDEVVAPSAVRPGVPPELDAICLRALAKDPDKRYQTAGEFKQAIEAVLVEQGFFRELGEVGHHMQRVFATQMKAQQDAVCKLVAYRADSSSGMPAIAAGSGTHGLVALTLDGLRRPRRRSSHGGVVEGQRPSREERSTADEPSLPSEALAAGSTAGPPVQERSEELEIEIDFEQPLWRDWRYWTAGGFVALLLGWSIASYCLAR